MTTITIQAAGGPRDVPAAWVGQTLAVHRPINADGLSKLPKWWAVTHVPTGYSMGLPLDATKPVVIQLARLWDAAATAIQTPADARSWPLARAWMDDRRAAERWGNPEGPPGHTD
jgi:hypothetical protein